MYRISEEAYPVISCDTKIYGTVGEGLRLALSLSCLSLGVKIFDKISEESPLGYGALRLSIYSGVDSFDDVMLSKTDKLFSNRFAKDEGYYLEKCGDDLVLSAYTEIGCMYGLMTLRQIISDGCIPESFIVEDYPDFLYRGNKWLSWAECGIWSYDRGDGIDAYRDRIIKKLDLCLEYKINSIVFEAFGWATDRFPGYNELMRTLNREARLRGVHLINNAYGMGYGLIGHGKGVYQGEAHYNRKSYPDGEIYDCIGTYELRWDENDVRGRCYGTCLSNDGLFEEKLSEITNYVKTTEPGALYIHNMDADYILEPLWRARCDSCRKKWPSDSLYDENGAAGAFAYFFEALYDRIAGIKTDLYDAERDCNVYIISPGYMYMHEDDEHFYGAIRFWKKVSSLIPPKKNLFFGFREHYYFHDSEELRFDALSDGFGDRRLACFDFCGGDGFYSDKLFLGGGLFLKLMKKCDAMIIENGNANQEPMQLYNAEYLWNCEKSAFYNVENMPSNYRDFEKLYIDYLKTNIRPKEIYGDGGLLEVICEKLYGKDASHDFKELYSVCGKDGTPPLTSLSSAEIYTNFTKVVYPMRWDNEDLRDSSGKQSVASILEKFIEVDKATCAARDICTRIYNDKKYLPSCEDDIRWMKDNFTLVSEYTGLFVRYMECYRLVGRHFEFGEKIPKETSFELSEIKKAADDLLRRVCALGLTPICPLGGAMVRREEMADFLSYNSEIMQRSIVEDKRMPSGRRPLRTRDHW